MTETFESQYQKKALAYTTIICSALLLLFIFIRWTIIPPAETVVQDLIELNLGSFNEGYGEEEPMVKGSPTVIKEDENTQTTKSEQPAENDGVTSDDNAEETAAPVTKTETKPKTLPGKNKVVAPVTPAPPKPKLVYQGTNTGNNGNNPDEDNYKNQGNNPNGAGDAGNAGGNTAGPKVISGNRKIVAQYKFDGDLSKATIYAIVKVSPDGVGSFAGFGKGTTNQNNAYANAIKNYLSKIKFNSSSTEDQVTIKFIFDVN